MSGDCANTLYHRGGSRIFEKGGGSILGLQAKKRGVEEGVQFWAQRGGGPDDPPPLDPPMCYYISERVNARVH